MSYSENPHQNQNPYQATWGNLAADAAADERTDFIRKTYLHLGGAVLAFIGLEALLLSLPIGPQLAELMTQRASWLVVMVLFVGVSFLSSSWAQSATSVPKQYAGLGLYVIAEAIIFLPILCVARANGMGDLIPQAGLITGFLFLGLTVIVWLTGHDFSYLRGILMIGGLASLAIVAWAVLFSSSSLGIPFSILMVALACGYILYDTSNVLHHYRIGQHVAASLALFASVALLFWYILRLLMQLNRR